MKLYYVIHSMLTQKGANTIKTISVAVGLLVSTLVFGRLDYNYNYDTASPTVTIYTRYGCHTTSTARS